MNLNLPTNSFQTLGYGTQSWISLAEGALARWNQVGVGIGQDHNFFLVRVPPLAGDQCSLDGTNQVRLASDVCGLAWGSLNANAITFTRSIGGLIVETDVIFNSLLPLNAYPGPTVAASGGGSLIDFFRLALHEFGHAAGLLHPNDAGQNVFAVMNGGNQVVGGPQSSVDNLQSDDIAGAHAIAFGASTASAILPSSRSVEVGDVATAFLTVINSSPFTALGVGISVATSIPAAFGYQTTSSLTNQPIGTPNTPVNIPPGSAQSFIVALQPSAPIAPTEVAFNVSGANTLPTGTLVGINTVLLSAAATPVPDIVALGATANNDGIVNIPTAAGTGVFAVATVNVGATGSITVSADTGHATLPLSISLCQTNPANGQCISVTGASVTPLINTNATPTFAIFVQGHGNVPFDPASNRIFVRFKDAAGATRGSTSVAVRTQ